MKLVVVLVGLPARGKSYVATKIVNWLRWRGSSAELFNVGKFRRQQVETSQAADDFFAPGEQATSMRDALAFAVLDSMMEWLKDGGDVAVLDATNTTRKRRADVLRRIESVSSVLPVCFLESMCNDAAVLHRNLLAKVTLSPDYCAMDTAVALADLKRRIAHYEAVYEPLDEGPVREDVSYIKLINLASKCVCNRIHGRLMHAIASFLMSIHVQPRPIYISRCGRSVGAVDERSKSSSADAGVEVSTESVAVAAAESEEPTNCCLPSIPPSVVTEPVVVAYTQTDDADLNEQGAKYARLMNAFVADQVLDYWHTHLVSRRSDNPEASPDQSDQHLSANAMAAATVFSPPVSSPSSPIITAAQPTAEPSPVEEDTESGSSDAEHSLRTGGCGTALPERSTAVIGSGSMVLTLERSKTNDTLPLVVYTSTLPRALQTVRDISSRALYVQQQSTLNAVDHGTLTGLTLDEIKESHPTQYAEWVTQRYRYRFPGGESQQDKARTLDSFMMELERQLFPVLIVSHASTLQILLGYFSNLRCDEYSSLRVQQHILIELTPTQYGWQERLYDFSDMTDKPKLVPIKGSIYSHAQNFYSS